MEPDLIHESEKSVSLGQEHGVDEIASILAQGYLRLLAQSRAESKKPPNMHYNDATPARDPLAIPSHQSDESNPLVNGVSASLQGG